MESNASGRTIVDRKYLRNQLQTTTSQLNLKYTLQAMIQERLKFYAALDYDILASYLPENIMIKASNEFLAKIKVVRADPLVHEDIPCIGINKVQDSESEQFLGDMDTEFEDSLNKYHRQDGSEWTEALEIRVWSHNSDERDYIAHVLKYILFEIRAILADLGVANQSITGGHDESDPVSYQPHVMFWVSYIYSGTIMLLSSHPATDPIAGIQLVEVDENGNLMEGNFGVTFMPTPVVIEED